MSEQYGQRPLQELAEGELIGVYDVFSDSIAARHFNGIFISGFSFASGHYGLPDTMAFTQRVRTILPQHHILVDIDDGYCDPEAACHFVSLPEGGGARTDASDKGKIMGLVCAYAAPAAVEQAMLELQARNGLLPSPQDGGTDLKRCVALLNENLSQRDQE